MEYYMVLCCKHISDSCLRAHRLNDFLEIEKDSVTVIITGKPAEVTEMRDWIRTNVSSAAKKKCKFIYDATTTNTVENLLLLKYIGIEVANVITSDYHSDRVAKILQYMGRYDDMLFSAPTESDILQKVILDAVYRLVTTPVTIRLLSKLYVIKRNFKKLLGGR